MIRLVTNWLHLWTWSRHISIDLSLCCVRQEVDRWGRLRDSAAAVAVFTTRSYTFRGLMEMWNFISVSERSTVIEADCLFVQEEADRRGRPRDSAAAGAVSAWWWPALRRHRTHATVPLEQHRYCQLCCFYTEDKLTVAHSSPMLSAGSVSGQPHGNWWWCHDPLLDAEHSLCTAPWSWTPCRTTSAHGRTMSLLDRAWKPVFLQILACSAH